MVAKPPVSESDLEVIATYLANPDCGTDIHIELHPNKVGQFMHDYHRLTGLTDWDSTHSTTDKFGIELRLHFYDLGNIPEELENLYIHLREGTWRKGNKIRVNHNNLIYQLFECGFVLGDGQDEDRIEEFMSKRF